MSRNEILTVSLDSGACIVEFEDKNSQITGYTKDEVIGKNWFEIFVPDQILVEVLEVFNSLFYGKDDYWEYQNEIRTKSGDTIMIKWENHLIKDKNNKPKYVFSTGVRI